jgi:hypothetical protein
MSLCRNAHRMRLCRIAGLVLGLSLVCASAAGQTAVYTYHNDTHRTGWNSTETVLTPSNVNATQFGLLATVPVDDQVDAVPLMIPNVQITAGNYQGQHNVVYVATANNTIFAIDADAGTVLLTQHLGVPVSEPLGCPNNGPNVGVNSTPVIDTNTNTLYVMAYTEGSRGPAYILHALNLGNLLDTVTPQVVAATHPLTNGENYVFSATYQRQRPALLEANGNIYAGFGSFCDHSTSISRGWVLGWNAATLAPLPASQLLQTQATNPGNFFLASVWMSGFGLAADDSGNVLFVTGNSDPSGTVYDGVTSIEESAIKVSPDLSTVLDLFTPSDWPSLDENDKEFGAGGLMILPDQPGSTPHLAVAAGKDGNMYFMNADKLGGYSPTGNNVLGTYDIQKCWCGPSYFMSGTQAFVVASGGNKVETFNVVTSSTPSLKLSATATLATGQNENGTGSGFFTSVSSNGTTNPIIWALSRPLSTTQTSVTLYALNPMASNVCPTCEPTSIPTMTQLFSAPAGNWPYYNGHYNQVPVVANGKVYVASLQQLQIFGPLSARPAAGKKQSPR